jgi:DNA-binding protein
MGAKRTTIIPKAPAARILMNAGAKRVSASAVDALVEVLEDITENIARKSAMIAKHAGRKTIQDGDVKLASKTM